MVVGVWICDELKGIAWVMPEPLVEVAMSICSWMREWRLAYAVVAQYMCLAKLRNYLL
jgi:hypothetical protein